MTIFIILGSVVVLAVLVIGFLFYMLSKETTKQTEKVVTVTEFKKSMVTPQETKPLESLQVPTREGAHAVTQSQESRITEEYMTKEAAYQKKVTELEEELKAVAQKAQQQSEEALAAREAVYQNQVTALQEELQTIVQKAQLQSEAATATIEQLKKDNEQLKSDQNNRVTAAEANLIKAQQTIESMQEEQGALQNRLSESQAQARKSQDEIVFIKQQMAQEIVQTKAETDKLVIENQTLQRSLEAAIAEAAKSFQDEINTLRQENQTLKSSSDDLTIANEKFKGLNQYLMEKSEGLQWELTKARAQMAGFERACGNYQQQLKDALERSGSMDQLQVTNNRLQTVLEDLQKQNEELTKREKLSGFELEKNRNQLVLLQRDYENLRAIVNNPSNTSS